MSSINFSQSIDFGQNNRLPTIGNKKIGNILTSKNNSLVEVSSLNQNTQNNSLSFKLHTVQDTIYRIQKTALTKYLKGDGLDPRLQQMNFLKASQMRNDEILTLQQAFFQEDTKGDEELQQRVQKVLNHFKVKQINNRQRYMKYFDANAENQEEDDFDQLQLHLKSVLESKLKSYQIFYGSHLVDPTEEELQKKDQKKDSRISKRKQHQSLTSLKLPSIQQPPQLRITYEGLSKKTVAGTLAEQRQMIKNLRKRFSSNSLDPVEEQFFNSIKIRDYNELQYMLKGQPGLVQILDEKGNTPLHVAVQISDTKIIKILLKFGANYSTKNSQGKTPPQLAYTYCNDEIIQILNDNDILNEVIKEKY